MRRACITGGAGFIGSNLADRLSADGVEVVIVDDFRTGRREFVAEALEHARASGWSRATCSTRAVLEDALEGCDWVFHLQANADVRRGLEHPRRDLEQNTIATSNVLEAMRASGVQADRVRLDRLGVRRARGVPDARGRALPASRPRSTRASKLAGEGLIAAYADRLRLHRA